MARSWRELAAAALASKDEAAPILPALPPEILTGLDRLRRERPPKVRNIAAWHEVVRDACWLANEGWAGKALSLGWHPLALYGIGPRSSVRFESLAVWLVGRRLVLLDSGTAIAASGPNRSIFHPPVIGDGGAVFLWDFGR